MGADLIVNDAFRQAIKDYSYLKNNHYPEKGSLKLIGDRYRLSTDQRTTLYRGISSREKSSERSQRIIPSPFDSLAIDGYNVLITLLNYRMGRFVFISNDGICRDAGSLFGKIPNESLFAECASLLIEYLTDYTSIAATIYLDSSVFSSKNHHTLIGQLARKQNIDLDVILSASADNSLLSDRSRVIATSDSAIIDGLEKPIVDIPKTIIERKYNYSIKKLGTLLK